MSDAPRLQRRLLILRLASIGSAVAGAAVTPLPAAAQYYNRGTGITDSDPNDGAGNGRGGYRPAPRGTGITDNDPSDGPGNGRGGYRAAPRRGTGISDSDPTDGAGNGRGGYGGRTGVTDSDPSDGPGRGRGYR